MKFLLFKGKQLVIVSNLHFFFFFLGGATFLLLFSSYSCNLRCVVYIAWEQGNHRSAEKKVVASTGSAGFSTRLLEDKA